MHKIISSKTARQPEQHGIERLLVNNEYRLSKGVTQRGNGNTCQHQAQWVELAFANTAGEPDQRAGGTRR
jgi:hypothetical protein